MPDERTFTFKECCALLKINPKSFLQWLRKAGIDPEEQRDSFDPRRKHLTKNQLIMIAKAHGRTLPPLDDDVEQPKEAMTNEALAEHLAVAQQQNTERFDQIMALLLEITSQQRDLRGHIESLTQHVDHLQQFLPPAISSSVQELVQSRIDGRSNGAQQAKRQDRPEPIAMPPAAPSSAPIGARAAKPSTKTAKKKKPIKGKRLPRGLMLLRDFAGFHQVAMDRASATAKSGKITIVRGKWLVNSRWATEALDARGQQEFYEVFHDRTGFVRCDQCPHTLPDQGTP